MDHGEVNHRRRAVEATPAPSSSAKTKTKFTGMTGEGDFISQA